jgi:hypothetical protein
MGVVQQVNDWRLAISRQNVLSQTDSHPLDVNLDARSLQRTHSYNAVVAHIVASSRNYLKSHLVGRKSSNRQLRGTDLCYRCLSSDR